MDVTILHTHTRVVCVCVCMSAEQRWLPTGSPSTIQHLRCVTIVVDVVVSSSRRESFSRVVNVWLYDPPNIRSAAMTDRSQHAHAIRTDGLSTLVTRCRSYSSSPSRAFLSFWFFFFSRTLITATNKTRNDKRKRRRTKKGIRPRSLTVYTRVESRLDCTLHSNVLKRRNRWNCKGERERKEEEIVQEKGMCKGKKGGQTISFLSNRGA